MRHRDSSIQGGFVSTGGTDKQRGGITEEQEQIIRWRTPMARRGRQDEIVGPVVFLASDASSLITGHVLPVDGGWMAW